MKYKLCIFSGYILLSLLSCTFCDDVDFVSCDNVHGKNFSRLIGSWKAHHLNGETKEMYNINICGGSLPSGCEGKAICKISSSENSFSFGDVDKPPVIKSTSSSSTNFYLEYNTTRLCSSSGLDKYYYRSSITFECGRSLGSPVVISADKCSVDFLWETSVACLSHETNAKDEVRCYQYDSKGLKRDLEVLIKLRGGHFVTDPSVESSGHDGVYINVCRDIQAHTLFSCPDGAAACFVKNGHSYLIGNLESALTIDSHDRLSLEYLASSTAPTPPECGSFTPRVVITFVCPGSRRGGSKLPIVTSSLNCQYNIEWWTEAACPEDRHTSKTCGLDESSHGVDLDLSQLTKTPPYMIDVHDDSQTKFLINVCAATGVDCGSKHGPVRTAAVCQTTKSLVKGYIAGEAAGYKVRYFDDQLSLVYSNGEKCSNGIRRMSIILFHCNETAGKGTPTFNHELHCTYYFDWQTSYACLAAPQCHVTDEAGLTYDLSPLTRIPGPGVLNWEALNGQAATLQSEDAPSAKKPRYFVNICGEVLRKDATSTCTAGASVCAIDGEHRSSFGSFANSSLIRKNNKLILTYHGGSACSGRKKTTTITFYCRLGDLESSPVIKYKSSDSCELSLTWHTAAACPVKSVTGDNCMVSDEESGLTFDLQSLSKSGDDKYEVSTPKYNYLLNVCEKLSGTPCNHDNRPASACQVELTGNGNHYTLGEKSRKLLYYNGFIKLLYAGGDPYRGNLYNRSTQISFLCDTKAGAGHPEFVKEGNHTYVFNWYTSHVCPAASTQCMVTDTNGNQYDLSSLAKSEDDQDENWTVLGKDTPGQDKRKYYLNVCRPVNDVRSSGSKDVGCNALAGACETSIVASSGEEHISVASMGRPRTGPQIEGKNRLILTYSGGSPCTEDRVAGNFSTRIHFVCEKGALASSPRFLERRACSVSFEWRTEAACPIVQSEGANSSLCEVEGANSKYTFNLQPLQRLPNNSYKVDGPSSSSYEINVCGNVTDCDDAQHDSSAGCKKASGGYHQRVGSDSVPVYSDDGRLTISYQAKTRDPISGELPTYEISFICNRTIAKGEPKFNSVVDDITRFDFQTSLACQPEAVDCLVTDDYGNQYDLSPLSADNQQWSVVGSDPSRRFHLSVCRPLPPITGCTGLASGACYTKHGQNGALQGHNLGLIQSNPQAVSGGSGGQNSAVSITYMGGDKCPDEKGRRYSTRILFQCSQEEGAAPVLQNDHSDPCEFYFVWQTPAACPIKKSASSSQNCTVTDPLYHMTFDLSALTQNKHYHIVTGGEWDYNVNICSKLQQATGDCKGYGSCQVKHSNPSTMNAAGRANSTLVYEDGVVTLSYLHGKDCHQNTYERSTTFRFTCHHDEQKPTFIKETGDCTYMVDWPTPHVCPPVKVVECLAQDTDGKQYDLSALSLPGDNYVASTRGDTDGRVYYINVCRSLLHRPGVTCPPNSAACFKTQGNKFYNLGQVSSGPRFVDSKLSMTYTNGDTCLHDTSKKYSTTITFQCDIDAPLNSSPILTGGGDSCDLEMLWVTRSACPVGSQRPSSNIKPKTGTSCAVVNPLTRHIFNLSTLASSTYHEIQGEDGYMFHLNVCKKVIDTNCADGTGNCIYHGDKHFSGGAASGELSYKEGALSLHYAHGKACEADAQHQHSTVISFVCHRSVSPSLSRPSSPATKPIYVSDDPHTCTHYFSWHTHIACEIQKPCAVVNAGPTTSVPHIIDFSSLISESGHYLALSELSGTKAAYYINVCRPLEPMHGVACPAGSAVCEVKPGNAAKTLGFVDPVEDILTYDDQSNTVTLRYASSRPCATSNTNVSTHIVFSCLAGATSQSLKDFTPDQTSLSSTILCITLLQLKIADVTIRVPGAHALMSVPRLTTITSDCVYLFEWGTELLCSTQPSPATPTQERCSYTDSTGVVFNLTKIDPVTIHDSTGTFKVSPCLGSLHTAGECKDASGCFTANSGRVFSLGASSTRKTSFGSNSFPVQVSFTNGTACPSSSQRKSLNIFFRCIRDQDFISGNKPQIIYNKLDQCHYSLYWPTPYTCPPPSESCVATYPSTGATYDLSLLSSLTHSWKFYDKDGNKYYINICRPLSAAKSWLPGCKEDAAVCRVTKEGKKTQSLGVLMSQKMQVTSPTTLTLTYSGGSQEVCEDQGMTASTIISFTCDRSVTGAPQFVRLTQDNCVFNVTWKSRIACLDEPEKVTLDSDGKFLDPKSGVTIDLSSLLQKTWTAQGDIRQEKNGPSKYLYAINLLGKLSTDGISSKFHEKCSGKTAVCQYKSKGDFARPVAEYNSTTTSYVMADESLEITFTSSDPCHKDKSKTSHVVISMRCAEYNGVGTPTFVYESNECGYFLEWYTDLMCAALSRQTPRPNAGTDAGSAVDSSVINARHSSASTIVLSILFAVLIIGILVLFLRKTERRIAAKQTLKRVFCTACTGQGGAQYRYIKSGNVKDENTSLFDDDDVVMREETSLLSPTRTERTDHGNLSNNPPIGGAILSDDDDIFSLPDVTVMTRVEKKASKPRKKDGKAKHKPPQAPNPFDETDDLLPLTNHAGAARVPGVGGEKVASYHDDDDDDMLDA